MMYNFNSYYGASPAWVGVFGPLLIIFVLWSIFWKGLALWHAGRKSQPWWFVIILLVNTSGILEIIYLFLVLKLKPKDLFNRKA